MADSNPSGSDPVREAHPWRLVQDLPAAAGPVTNPCVNYCGGAGALSVSLRGLGSARVLVLVNGHRINNADVHSIPSNAIKLRRCLDMALLNRRSRT